jgi:hypothetical protein
VPAKPKRVKKSPVGNLAIRLVAAPKGFWLFAVATKRVYFKIEYFALGTGGHQRRGTVEGSIRARDFRQFVNLRFDSIVVGICDAVLWTDGENTDATELLTRPPQFPAFPQIVPSTLMSPEGAITKLTIARRPSRGGGPAAGRFRGTYDLYDLYGAYGLYGEYGIYGGYGLYDSSERSEGGERLERADRNTARVVREQSRSSKRRAKPSSKKTRSRRA